MFAASTSWQSRYYFRHSGDAVSIFEKIGLYCETAAICGPSCSEAFDFCHYSGCSIWTYCLQKYGRVYSQRWGKIQSHPSVCNGRHHIRMDIHMDIPSFLRFGKFFLRVFHEGQPKTCRRCNSPDHLAKDCNNTFCFNCDSIGHVSKQCPSIVKCCICKEESHKAIDCQLSWS